MKLNQGDKIGIVGCSNAQLMSYKPKIDLLLATIRGLGLIPVCSSCIYEKYSVFSGTGGERAEELNRFYTDPEIKAIFDISGGDVVNELLEYLDFDGISRNPKPFFGYSDLTTILNAVYAKTGQVTYLYQLRNLIYSHKNQQQFWFRNSLLEGQQELFDFDYSFLRGDQMEGVVIGGNLRCLLKLAGTPYLPDFENKILLLESYSGDPAVVTTLLCQLKQMGVFAKVNGLLLGTFTEMEKEQYRPSVWEMLSGILGQSTMPVAQTHQIGHGTDSKAVALGKYLRLAAS